jgi:hypothetical protein
MECENIDRMGGAIGRDSPWMETPRGPLAGHLDIKDIAHPSLNAGISVRDVEVRGEAR